MKSDFSAPSGGARSELFPAAQPTYFEHMQKMGSAHSERVWFNFDHLTPDVRRHLQRVYILLTVTIAAAFFGSYCVSSLHIVINGAAMLALFIASLGLVLAIGLTRSTPQNAWWRSMLLIAFGFLQGIAVTPLVQQVAQVDAMIPTKAFLLTAVVFICFSVSALSTAHRHYLYLGGVLFSALSTLAILGFLNMFMKSSLLETAYLWGGIVLFSFFVAFDTQMIIERSLNDNMDSVHSALDLFLDAMAIFIRIMILLSRNKKSSGGGAVTV